jgi:hypothetical protein
MKYKDISFSEIQDSKNEKTGLEYFEKNDGERLANFFEVFEASPLDNEFEDGKQNTVFNAIEEDNWHYNHNNIFNHTIEELKIILAELKRPLLDMVDGKADLKLETFNINTIKIKYINWFIKCKYLHEYINREKYIENIIKNNIIESQKKLRIIESNIKSIESKIDFLKDKLAAAENDKHAAELIGHSYRTKLNLLHKFTSSDSDPLSVINKCVFLNFIDSSIEEINEFKLNSPNQIHDLLDEMINSLFSSRE